MQAQLDHVRKALMRAQLPHAAQQGRAAASLPRRIRNTRGRPARDSGAYPNLAHNPIKLQISRLRGICWWGWRWKGVGARISRALGRTGLVTS